MDLETMASDYKTGGRLVIHTDYGIIVFETRDKEEIQAALRAVEQLRRERSKRADYREREKIGTEE